MPRNVFLEKYSIDAGTGDFVKPEVQLVNVNHPMPELLKIIPAEEE
jgi:hypothetical protein